MAKVQEISKEKKVIVENAIQVKPEGVKSVSYSQYSVYKQCPYRWNLTYKEGMFPFTSSISTVFGTALHETLQHYLTVLYTGSVKESEEIVFADLLYANMVAAYREELKKNGGVHFIDKADMEEHYEDGLEILHYLRKKRKILFDYRNIELVAVELPGYVPIFEDGKLVFNYFLDLVFYDRQEGRYLILDVKTSKKGWTDYQKKDVLKLEQVLLYKKYFSKFYNVTPDQIEVKFLIVKRKVSEDFDWPIPRHTMFIPAQGAGKVNSAVINLEDFVKNCFNMDGTFKEVHHPKTPSKNSCKFCPYANTEYCNMIAD
jgi:hypothetical protein